MSDENGWIYFGDAPEAGEDAAAFDEKAAERQGELNGYILWVEVVEIEEDSATVKVVDGAASVQDPKDSNEPNEAAEGKKDAEARINELIGKTLTITNKRNLFSMRAIDQGCHLL
jgi:hypothetical protein